MFTQGGEKLAPVAKREAEFLQVVVGEMRQHLEVYVVFRQHLAIVAEADAV